MSPPLAPPTAYLQTHYTRFVLKTVQFIGAGLLILFLRRLFYYLKEPRCGPQDKSDLWLAQGTLWSLRSLITATPGAALSSGAPAITHANPLPCSPPRSTHNTPDHTAAAYLYVLYVRLAVDFTKVRTATAVVAFYGVLIKSLASLKGSTRVYILLLMSFIISAQAMHLPPHTESHVHPRGNRTRTFPSLSVPLSLSPAVLHTSLPVVFFSRSSYLFTFYTV